MIRLKEYYSAVNLLNFVYKINQKNLHTKLKFKKIIIHQSLKNLNFDKTKLISNIVALEIISNQKALPVKSKKSNINLKIRTNMIVGSKTILRRDIMYNFIDNFINIMLPKIDNFSGFSRKNNFDNFGNFNFNISNILLFNELMVEYERFAYTNNITISIILKKKNLLFSKLLFSSTQFPIN
jgi:large subunit ribosomal protein L5